MMNKEEIKKELRELGNQGLKLRFAFRKSILTQAEYEDIISSSIDALGESYFVDIPNFELTYQTWYSKSLKIINLIIPERSTDFTDLYRTSQKRSKIDYENYTIEDALSGLTIRHAGIVKNDPKSGFKKFDIQCTILDACIDIVDDRLSNILLEIQADVFDSEIDSAKHLASKGYLRAAGAIAGVVIEKHLKIVCERHAISIRKRHPGISDLSQSLKDADVIDTPTWRQISRFSDIRNYCDHAKEREPTKDEVNELVAGAAKLTKSIF